MIDNPRGQIFAILGRTGVTRRERLQVCSFIATRTISSLNVLNERELQHVAGTLFSWDAAGHLEARLAEILSERAA